MVHVTIVLFSLRYCTCVASFAVLCVDFVSNYTILQFLHTPDSSLEAGQGM